MAKKLPPLTFEWTDQIQMMEDPAGGRRLKMSFNWATLEFSEVESRKLARLRPFYGDKVNIRVEFFRGRLREAQKEDES